MNQKQVCQLDQDGYFTGLTTADESPLEPGVFLMPARTVETDPPKQFPGQRCKWTGAKWEYEDISAPAIPIPTPTLTAKESCVLEAKRLLAKTDWSQLPDVVGTLANASMFVAYRAEIRALMKAPIDSPAWPTMPEAEWSE